VLLSDLPDKRCGQCVDFTGLHVPEIRVRPIRCKQFIVGSALNELSIIQYEHVISVTDCRESMCNDKYRPIGHQRVEIALDQHFSFIDNQL
jgi:hypothetical protein